MTIVTGTIPSSEASGHLAFSSIALEALVINVLTIRAIPSLTTVLPIQLSSRKARGAVREAAREMLSECLMTDPNAVLKLTPKFDLRMTPALDSD